MRSLLLLAACRAAAGFARWSATGDAMGLQQLRDAVQWMEGRSAQFYVSVQYAWLVEACVAMGDTTTARRYARHVLRRTREDERLGEAATCRALARMAAARRAFGLGRRWLRRAEASANLRGSEREGALNQAALAELLHLQGDTETARRTMAEAAARLRTLNMPWHAERAIRGLERPAPPKL
jgi:hypothetical protein